MYYSSKTIEHMLIHKIVLDKADEMMVLSHRSQPGHPPKPIDRVPKVGQAKINSFRLSTYCRIHDITEAHCWDEGRMKPRSPETNCD